MSEGRIDFHNHIIPGVDDGSKSIEESLEMARQAVDAGVSLIICSSHLNRRTWLPEYDAKVTQSMDALNKALENASIPVTVKKGYEIAIDRHLSPLQSVFHGGLNQLPVFLIELPMMGTPLYMLSEFFEFHVNKFQVVIAHPERCIDFESKKEEFQRAIEMGVLIQLDAGSITGQFGRKVKLAAEWLIKNKAAHFICSDAHSTGSRSYLVYKEAIQIVTEKYGHSVAENLTITNPSFLIKNETSKIAPVIPEDKSLLSRIIGWKSKGN